MPRKQQRRYLVSVVVLFGIGGVVALVSAHSEFSIFSRVAKSISSILRSSRAGEVAPKGVSAEEGDKLRAAAESIGAVSDERENILDTVSASNKKSVFLVPPGFENNPVAPPRAEAVNQQTSSNNQSPSELPDPQSPKQRFSFGDGGRAPVSPPVDTTPPTVTAVTQSFSGNNLRINVSATDESGIGQYEAQFILPDFVSGTPRTACAGNNQTVLPATSTLLQDVPKLFVQLSNIPCTWFVATPDALVGTGPDASVGAGVSASSLSIPLASDLDGLSFASRARATDGAGNTSDWVYAEAALIEFAEPLSSASTSVVISEIAWMGTAASPNDEWLELFNTGPASTSLNQWQLVWGAFSTTTGQYERTIDLSGLIIGPYRTIVLERTNDTTISDRAADKIYTGALGNGGEHLRLLNSSDVVVDEVNASAGWFAGSKVTKESMSRRDFFASGNSSTSWCTFLSCPNDGLFSTPQSGRDANGNPLNGSPGWPLVE